MRPAAVVALLALAGPALGQDFAEGSQAKEWNLYGEEKALFAATVVDPLCELTGEPLVEPFGQAIHVTLHNWPHVSV